jgi:hypothetical protein
MCGVVIEEQAISRAQYLDLVYSQMGTLYDLILDAHRPSTNPTPTPPIASHVVDGVIGTFHAKTQSRQASHSNPKSTTPNVQNTPPPTPSPDKTSEVNSVQSTPTGKNQNKKKGRVKIKRTKIRINNLIDPRLNLLMTKTSENLIILALFLVRLIIQKIVHDMLTLLSSWKGLGHLLLPSFCHNHFLLIIRPNWSFITNLIPLPHVMYLCVLVTPRKMNL